MNQRISLAFSDDLYSWTKSRFNPIVTPDPDVYVWDPDGWWSDFRDPFVWAQDGIYHMLVTAKLEGDGVLFHGVSVDLENWIDIGYIFRNDGIDPWRVLESPQYKVLNDDYYLLFGEYDTGGISCVPSDLPANWTMENRQWIDYGYAPELDEFDEGTHIFSRIAPFDTPATGIRSYVVRLDTMIIGSDGILDPYQPHPLEESWASWTGSSNLAQPTWGDNSASRGDDPVGLVGNGYYGSKEYYQGPLSGRGSPGTMLGDAATGVLKSPEFRITGNRMTLLVGGGYYPETCYVALIDSETDTIIYSETGTNQELMTLRQWDLTPYQDRLVSIQIVDQENGDFGHINVDEIHEDFQDLSPVDDSFPFLARVSHRAWPNPFNPRTKISFDLPRDLAVDVKIHDLRGRLVWRSGARSYSAGTHAVDWNGLGTGGTPLPAGTYLYRLESGSQNLGSGKLSLVK
jgi:sucrose-6-phosphate hydrolase SacC (GH32 family)